MSKTKIAVIVAIVLLLVVGGVSYSKFKNDKVSNNTSGTAVESKGVFSSIKDALSKNITLVCEFKDDSGVSTKSYIKNGAVRVSSEGEIIMKDKKMYMWDTKTKKGFVYDVPDSEETNNKVGMTGSEVVKSDQYLNMIETYKDSCKVSNVEDSYFTIPVDIEFQDMSKFLEDLKSQMPQIELPQQ